SALPDVPANPINSPCRSAINPRHIIPPPSAPGRMLLFPASRVKSGGPEGTGENCARACRASLHRHRYLSAGCPAALHLLQGEPCRSCGSSEPYLDNNLGWRRATCTWRPHAPPRAPPRRRGFSRIGGTNERVDIATRHPGDGGYTAFR